MYFKQAEVLKAAGIATETLCGDLCQERWSLAYWQQMCSSCVAIVMTPDACVFSLMHTRLKVNPLECYFVFTFPRTFRYFSP